MTSVSLSVLPAVDQSLRIREIFKQQAATALRLRSSTVPQRIAKLKRLREAIVASSEAIYAAGWADYRKPPAEVDVFELLPALSEANDAISNLKKWMKPRRVWPTMTLLGTSSYSKCEPRGRCLIISPWNFPFNLTFGPLISAVAAGNTAIVKPSELSPHCSAVSAKVIREVFTEDEVAVIEGDAGAAQALLELPFDHIFFTGSPAIGKVVMKAASQHLASVTLELGGRNPTIVDESAELHAAAQNILWSRFANGGQMCVATDHVYVHSNVKEAFIDACTSILDVTYGRDVEAQQKSPDFARVVNERHTRRISNLLDDAKQRGAKVRYGGHVDLNERFISPTIIDKIPVDAEILREEIFGPLLPIVEFRDLTEAIDGINREHKALALHIWSTSQASIDRVLRETSSGTACVNHSVAPFAHLNLPFGGVGHSGIGNSHGYAGFKAFSHERSVVKSLSHRIPTMFFPPYGRLVRWVTRFLMRWG